MIASGRNANETDGQHDKQFQQKSMLQHHNRQHNQSRDYTAMRVGEDNFLQQCSSRGTKHGKLLQHFRHQVV